MRVFLFTASQPSTPYAVWTDLGLVGNPPAPVSPGLQTHPGSRCSLSATEQLTHSRPRTHPQLEEQGLAAGPKPTAIPPRRPGHQTSLEAGPGPSLAFCSEPLPFPRLQGSVGYPDICV